MRSAWICFASAPYTHRAAVDAAHAVLEPVGWKVYAPESAPENGSDGTPQQATIFRTARRLAEGRAYLKQPHPRVTGGGRS